MEDFLKDRPVHAVHSPSAASAAKPAGGESPFPPIQRSHGSDHGGDVVETAERSVDAGGTHDGAKVRAIVERGRVTRLVVTCSCGKVTEVACVY